MAALKEHCCFSEKIKYRRGCAFEDATMDKEEIRGEIKDHTKTKEKQDIQET